MLYFIADQHFFHRNMLTQMDNRGFGDVDQMNEYMIYQWNSRVRHNDEVVILGDFSMGTAEQTAEVLRQLKGRKYLIEGNHDKRYLKNADFDSSLFKWIKQYHEMHDNKRKICLCHYPIMCYNGQYHFDANGVPYSFMLYGHTHNTFDETIVRNFQLSTMNIKKEFHNNETKNIPCNMINCFCMFSNYVPLTLDEWINVRHEQLLTQIEMNKAILTPPKPTGGN